MYISVCAVYICTCVAKPCESRLFLSSQTGICQQLWNVALELCQLCLREENKQKKRIQLFVSLRPWQIACTIIFVWIHYFSINQLVVTLYLFPVCNVFRIAEGLSSLWQNYVTYCRSVDDFTETYLKHVLLRTPAILSRLNTLYQTLKNMYVIPWPTLLWHDKLFCFPYLHVLCDGASFPVVVNCINIVLPVICLFLRVLYFMLIVRSK